MKDDPPSIAASRGSARFLDAVERIGNRLPDPLVLFLGLALAVPLLSALAVGLGWERAHPVTGEAIRAVNLLELDSLRRILGEAVTNFTSFPPLGVVLVTMLGVGLAERSGFIAACLRSFVARSPRRCLAPAVVFAGVLANLATDAGFVVLVPLGAAVFAGAGRHPLAGLCAAFAGVAGGFSANLAITPLDPLLAGLTEAAARLYDPAATLPPTANYYFMFASTFLVVAAGWWVTEAIVEPRLGPWRQRPLDAPGREGEDEEEDSVLDPADPARSRRALLEALLGSGLALLAVLTLFVPPGSFLRDADGGLAPLYAALIPLLAALFAIPGLIYGWRTGAIRRSGDVARMLSETMAGMGGYVVLAFFAAQFIAYFQWSNLGILVALAGADALRATGAGPIPLLLGVVLLCGAVNLLIGSASAKWALLAPIVVPMMMSLGFPPETAQAAFRVGDSCTNTITPLLPYFPVVLAFARRYAPETGLGTLVSAMMPYSIAFGLAWSALLAAWFLLGWPLGPGLADAAGG